MWATCPNIHNTTPSPLQTIALKLAEGLYLIVDEDMTALTVRQKSHTRLYHSESTSAGGISDDEKMNLSFYPLHLKIQKGWLHFAQRCKEGSSTVSEAGVRNVIPLNNLKLSVFRRTRTMLAMVFYFPYCVLIWVTENVGPSQNLVVDPCASGFGGSSSRFIPYLSSSLPFDFTHP
ncbi:hypothetical protein IW261DRAFT_1574310 [Armillaria novae-zelandiae]|uniref:Uncharacterized protein n=1 Tax=Armillaria novae-zelandiae TaxID=153914 RepID=A0AA39NJ74_9AGAR|nr:hypothetical protein IW261DRAFT_1574310 [Armillaria novae-zelandiae]